MEKLGLIIITKEFKCASVRGKNGNISAQFLLGESGKVQVPARNANTPFCSYACCELYLQQKSEAPFSFHKNYG